MPHPLDLQIAFRGGYVTDPGTANNNDHVRAADIPTAEIAEGLRCRSDADVTRYLTTLIDVARGPRVVRTLPAGWNYYGTNGFWFNGVEVKGAWTRGRRGANHLDRAWDEMPVEIRGHGGTRAVMVDLDPSATHTTQVFSGAFVLGRGAEAIRLENPTRAHAGDFHETRLLLDRPHPWAGLGAVFSAGVAAGNVVLPPARVDETGVLAALRSTVALGWGVQIVWVLYGTRLPVLDMEELAERFARGESPHNPVTGLVNGFIRPWKASAGPAARPIGRRLAPDPFTVGPSACRCAVGPSWVVVDPARRALVLDLLNCIPEEDIDGSKVDLGDLELGYQAADGFHLLGVVPLADPGNAACEYRRRGYWARGGTVDIRLPPNVDLDALAEHPLVLRRAGVEPGIRTASLRVGAINFAAPNLLGMEPEWTLTPETMGVYLERAEVPTCRPCPTQVSVRVEARRYGILATPPEVIVSGYETGVVSGGVTELVVGAILETETGARRFPVSASATCSQEQPGDVVVSLRAQAPGTASLLLQVTEAPLKPDPFTALLTVPPWIGVRVLSSRPTEPLAQTGAALAHDLLRYYARFHPGMNQHLDLGAVEAVITYGPRIRQRLAPEPTAAGGTWFEDTRYMPVTRDLPDWKRELIVAWLLVVERQERPSRFN
jgi:hypothetical protein